MQTDNRDEWLSELGERLSIPKLAFNNAGVCLLTFDKELLVSVFKQPETSNLVLFGQLPITRLTPEMMQRMLVENRDHSKLAAPVFSVSEDLDAIEVHFKFTQEELKSAPDPMGQLVGALEYWRGVVGGAAQ